MEKQIHWYPGHMAKAIREIEEKVKLVDIIIELVDARAPKSSRNPMIEEIIGNKPVLILMTKKDLADPTVTNLWINYYRNMNKQALALDLNHFTEYKKIISICKEELKETFEKNAKKGLKPRAVRALILGVPNVGKSTLINRLAKRSATKTGNMPGVTKSQQLIRIDKDFELFDTPGVLWPKFDDELTAKNIALIGSIKNTILPLDDLYIYAAEYLSQHFPKLLMERYKLMIDLDSDWIESSLIKIGTVKNIKRIGNEVDYDRVIEAFFNDLFSGALGKITWEKPNGKI